jgi:6-phosphogluconate dehydrogenase (decarboxylating)
MERALMYALNNGIEFGMLQAIAAAVDAAHRLA